MQRSPPLKTSYNDGVDNQCKPVDKGRIEIGGSGSQCRRSCAVLAHCAVLLSSKDISNGALKAVDVDQVLALVTNT